MGENHRQERRRRHHLSSSNRRQIPRATSQRNTTRSSPDVRRHPRRGAQSTDQWPCVYLYLVDDCHYHTISSVTGFFSAGYFCSSCLQHYNNKERHECEVTCIVCKTMNCPETEEPVMCQKCHMTCRSQKCYQRHNTKNKGRSECEMWWKCMTCYKVINTTKREKEDHRCGEYHCTSCDKYVMRDHLCYLRSIPAKEEFISKFIFADFECSQDERAVYGGIHPSPESRLYGMSTRSDVYSLFQMSTV